MNKKEKANRIAVDAGIRVLKGKITSKDKVDFLFYKVIQAMSKVINKQAGRGRKKTNQKDLKPFGVFRHQDEKQPDFACWQLAFPKWNGPNFRTMMRMSLKVMKVKGETTGKFNNTEKSYFEIITIPGKDLKNGQFPNEKSGVVDAMRKRGDGFSRNINSFPKVYNLYRINVLLKQFMKLFTVSVNPKKTIQTIVETRTFVRTITTSGAGVTVEDNDKTAKVKRKILCEKKSFEPLGTFILGRLYLDEPYKGPTPYAHYLTWIKKSLGEHGGVCNESDILIMPVEKILLQKKLEEVEKLFEKMVKWNKKNLQDLRALLAQFHLRMALLRPFVHGNDRMAKLIERVLYMFHTNDFPEYKVREKLYDTILTRCAPAAFENDYIKGDFFVQSPPTLNLGNSKQKNRHQTPKELRENHLLGRSRSGTFSVSPRLRNGKKQ